MKLLVNALKNELGLMMKNNIRLNAIGHTDMMPTNVQQELQEVLDETKKIQGLY